MKIDSLLVHLSLIIFQLYRVYRGEAIVIEVSPLYSSFNEALFVSKSGNKGIHISRVTEFDTGAINNGFPKISLLAANFQKLQERVFSFGITVLWYDLSWTTMADITRKAFEGNTEMTIDLEFPPVLSPFTLTDLQAAFYLVFILLGISTVLFLGEILASKIGRKRSHLIKSL